MGNAMVAAELVGGEPGGSFEVSRFDVSATTRPVPHPTTSSYGATDATIALGYSTSNSTLPTPASSVMVRVASLVP
jgi:hypothetical protein